MERVRAALKSFMEYDTPKIVHIKSKKVGFINRFFQVAIIGYIIGWVFIYKKGYQEFDEVTSGVTTKLKGVVFTNRSDIPSIGRRIWDVSDYVNPPLENNAFFVMTNMIISPEQRQGQCAEDPSIRLARCDINRNHCAAGQPVPNGNGVMTGNCIPSREQNISTCEIYAWCPVEVDELPDKTSATLVDSKYFTVLLKNWIEFEKFSVKRRNILDGSNKTYLTGCHYHSDSDPFCPIFVLNDIVKGCGEDYNEMAIKGGIVGIEITWNCNLDFSINYCIPKYSFRRLDMKDAKIAPGWNFRYAHYYRYDNGTEARDLFKSYGIRFIVFVKGTAGKFSVVPMLLNIGSGIALLGISTILCDIVVLYILKKGRFYSKKKYQMVTVPADQMNVQSGEQQQDFDRSVQERDDLLSSVDSKQPRQRQTASEGTPLLHGD